MLNKEFILFLKYAAFAGNILFILWVTYNGINEGFRGTVCQKISYFSLMGLLILNCVLLFIKTNQADQNNRS